MSQPHVIHIIDHLGLGGAQRLVADVAMRQAHRGTNVAIITLRGPTALGATIAAAGVDVHYLGLSRRNPCQITSLYALLHSLHPAIVHLHLMGAQTLGRLAAVLAGVPAAVIHDHEASAEIYSHPGPLLALRRLIEPVAPPCHTLYIAVSADAATYATVVGHRPAHQIAVIPNGVDISYINAYDQRRDDARHQLGLPTTPRIIVSAGRLRFVKGFDLLLEAIAKLPGVHLAIAGDGPEREILKVRIAQPDLASRVHLLGHLDDIRPLLRAGDIYTQPSRREAFGLAAVEAAAAGLPVVASAVGGLRQVVRHGETGMLLPPEQPAHLAVTLAQLLNDPALVERLGTAGQVYVQENFSIERVVDRIEEIYQTLLETTLLCHTMTSGATSK